jgi:hypothetical protein
MVDVKAPMAMPRTRHHFRRARAGLLAAAIGLTALLTAAVPAASPAPAHERQIWVATRTTVGRLEAVDPGIARRFFDEPTAFALGGWGTSVPSMAWASEAAFARDLANGVIPADVRAVMYDPEFWTATPLAEQRDPVGAMRRFASLARTHGYLVILTPHPNLTAVPGGACVHQADETIQAAFLRCRLSAAAASLADVVEIQGQFLEVDTDAYRAFVTRAADQARAAHRDVRVIAGLSTNFTDDPSVLFSAWAAVRDVVDGQYIAVPEGIRPNVAAGFLRLVADQVDAGDDS